MPNPYLLINHFKIAPFKYETNLPYGALANTTKAGIYPIKQVIRVGKESFDFIWPSSEHAFHAQKILHLINKSNGNEVMTQILIGAMRQIERTKASPGNVFLPRDDWDPIIESLTKNHPHLFGANKQDFDALCDSNYHCVGNPNAGLMPNGEPYTLNFMREVVRLKLEQHPVLKNLAIECAREGILPIEVSQHDVNWATGQNGNGANMLGIVILELGNYFLKQIEPQALLQISNPKSYYQQLQRCNQQQLSHASLVSYTSNMNAWVKPISLPQTSRVLLSGKETQYYQSEGGNKRLVLQNHRIVGYEYRNGLLDNWKQSAAPSRYTDLIRTFQKQQGTQVMQVNSLEHTKKQQHQSSSVEFIGLMILGGVIAAAGIAAVVIAFTVLNAAILGTAGLVVAGLGIAAALSGTGLFAGSAYKNSQKEKMEFEPVHSQREIEVVP
jgi:predicted NAD-dependent protein-ADP-ribosyltransferase YbiA (DUF1768 family)